MIYSICFGASSFLPFIILYKERSIFSNLFLYTFTNFRAIFGLLFLEAFLKISFIISIVFIISFYDSNIQINIGSDFSFNRIQEIGNSSIFKQKILYGIALLTSGVISFFWDIFKSFYLSFLYLKNEQEAIPKDTL